MPKSKKNTTVPTAKNGEPQVHKTPEQIKLETEQAVEVKRQRALAVNVLYPILLKGSTSIANATQMLGTLNMTINQAFQNKQRDMTLADLKLPEQINQTVPQADYYMEMLKVLENENVATANGLIKGISDELERLFRKEMAERSLSTLKTDFIIDENGDEQKSTQ